MLCLTMCSTLCATLSLTMCPTSLQTLSIGFLSTMIERISPCDNGEPHHTILAGGSRPPCRYISQTAASARGRSAGSVQRPICIHQSRNSAARAFCASVSFSICNIANLFWRILALADHLVVTGRQVDRVVLVVLQRDRPL